MAKTLVIIEFGIGGNPKPINKNLSKSEREVC